MSGWRIHALGLALVAVLASCADEKADPARPAAPKSFRERLNENNGFKQDAEGNWVPRSDKRSQFERKGESPYFRGERTEKEYRTGDYRKTSWWGRKSYQKPAWQGGTDGSRFRKTARQQGVGAVEAGSTARLPGAYRTGRFATAAANETRHSGVERVDDAETQIARDSYQAPEVVGWGKQRDLSRSETKSLLGR